MKKALSATKPIINEVLSRANMCITWNPSILSDAEPFSKWRSGRACGD
jgi:hypothetical protein